MTLSIRELTVPISGCQIVKDISFTLEPGKLTGLIGANGAGKSTLLRAIAGLLPEAEGEVFIDDVSSNQMTPRQRAHRLAYLPQGGQIDWALSVRDVVRLGRFPFQGRFGHKTNEDEAIVSGLLTRLGLEALEARQATSLSGGERALTLLARALAVGAPYLLADEPTAALDPARQLEVMDLMSEEARSNKGVLVVLHDLSLASRYLDEVVLLHQGEMIANGPPAEVLTPELLEQSYGVTPLMGEENGERWMLPWRRTSHKT